MSSLPRCSHPVGSRVKVRSVEKNMDIIVEIKKVVEDDVLCYRGELFGQTVRFNDLHIIEVIEEKWKSSSRFLESKDRLLEFINGH